MAKAKIDKPVTPPPLNEIIPRADDVYLTEPEVAITVTVEPADAPTESEQYDASADAQPAASTEAGTDAPAEEPPPSPDTPPVIVTFARPPLDVENAIRAAHVAGQVASMAFIYLRWAREEKPDADMDEAIDASRWLVAQPVIEPEVTPEEDAYGRAMEDAAEGYDRPPLRLVPKAAPVVATITPAAPAKEKISPAKEIDFAFPLTPDERFQVGLRSVELGLAIEVAKEEAAADRKRHNDAIKALTAHRALLDDVYKKGEEVRKVRVVYITDYEAGHVRMVNAATLETIGEPSPLREEDRQLTLFGAPKVTPAPTPTEGGSDSGHTEDPDADEDEDEDDDDE